MPSILEVLLQSVAKISISYSTLQSVININKTKIGVILINREGIGFFLRNLTDLNLRNIQFFAYIFFSRFSKIFQPFF